MKSEYVIKYIYFLIILTISINIYYTIDLINSFFQKSLSLDNKDYIISAIALEVSWILLMVWFMLNPIQRKDILILTIVPMIIANILNNYNLELFDFLLNLSLLSLFISLYLLGYYLLREIKI